MSQPSEKVQPTANPSCEQLRMPSGSVPGVGNMGVSTTSTGPSLDPDTLRKTAEAATPGPWMEFHENGTPGEYEAFICPPATGAHLVKYAPQDQRDKDALHIATFDPPTVLALITRLEQAEQQRDSAREACKTLAEVLSKHSEWIVEATDSQDLIGDDGDGDWDVVWDRVTELGEAKRKAEQAVERVRELATGDPIEYGWSEAMFAVLRALDGDTRG